MYAVERGLALDPCFVHFTGKQDAVGRTAAEAFAALRDPPTGFLIPEPRVAASFIRARDARGLPVEHHAVVMGKDPLRARVEGLNDWPCIFTEESHMASALFTTLARAVQHTTLPGETVLLSPDHIRLP